MTASLEISPPRSGGGALHGRIGAMLGLGRVGSDADLHRLVDRELPVKVIAALGAHGFSDAEIFELVLPRRTLAHRRSRGQPLTREESDRAVRLARIAAFAEKVFADPGKAARWLRKPKHRFDGRTPLQMLQTEAGARLVEETLLQIDEGYFA